MLTCASVSFRCGIDGRRDSVVSPALALGSARAAVPKENIKAHLESFRVPVHHVDLRLELLHVPLQVRHPDALSSRQDGTREVGARFGGHGAPHELVDGRGVRTSKGLVHVRQRSLAARVSRDVQGLLWREERCHTAAEEVHPLVGNHVHRQLAEIHVQGSLEPNGCCEVQKHIRGDSIHLVVSVPLRGLLVGAGNRLLVLSPHP